MSVGAELAQARERLGLSRDDISSRTKISVERLAAIEEEDVAALPPLVYLKGFVREFAAAVSLDPEDVTRRYVAELDDVAGLMSATVPELPLAPSEYQLSPLPTAPIVQPRTPAVTRSILGEDDLPPLGADDLPRIEATTVDEFPSEHAAALRRPRLGRMAAVVAIAALGGFFISSQSSQLSSWWKSRSTPREAVAATASPERDASRAAQPLPTDRARKPDEVSPAFAPNEPDAARRRADAPATGTAPSAPGATVEPSASAPVAPVTPSSSAPVAPRSAAPDNRTARDAAVAPENRTAPSAPVAPAPSTPAPSAPVASSSAARENRTARGAAVAPEDRTSPTAPDAPVAPVAPPASAPALTGSWSLTTRIESTDYEAFKNLNLGYRIQLRQQGDRITGKGLKWMENGKAIPARSRTPIAIEGVRLGDRLELRFTEQGTRRTSTGTFVMVVGADGTLRGQFASTSANSSGSSIARRSPEQR